MQKRLRLVIASDDKIPVIREHLAFLAPSVKNSLIKLGVVFDNFLSFHNPCKKLVQNF